MLSQRRNLIMATGAVFSSYLSLAYLHSRFNPLSRFNLLEDQRLYWTLALASLVSLAAYALGVPATCERRGQVVARTLGASLVGLVLLALAQLVVGSAFLARSVVLGGAALLVPMELMAWNLLGDSRSAPTRAIVVASADAYSEIYTNHETARTHRPVNVLRHLEPGEMVSFGTRTPLVDLANELSSEMIVLDQAAQNEASIVSQAALLHQNGMRVRTLSMFSDEFYGKVPISEVQRVSLLFDIGEVHRRVYPRFRRLVDLGFVLMASPVVLIVAVVLGVLNPKWNKGPLLYRQTRIGKGGEPFEILKFRSMTTGAGTDWTSEDDARVTALGRIIRTSHLDELPQIVNIFRGELTLVGPRPEQVEYVSELTAKLPFYGVRHIVRPGLTGWAQVSMGYTSDLDGALEKLQYELYYLRHQSLSLDLEIMSRTFNQMVGRGGR